MRLKNEGCKRNNLVSTRFTREELKTVKDRAMLTGRTVANYIWWYMVEGYKTTKEEKNSERGSAEKECSTAHSL